MASWTIQGRKVPEELTGTLTEFDGELTDGPAIQKSLAENGYLLLRSALDRDEVLTAREEIFLSLEQVGEIKPPAIDGVATGKSQRREKSDDDLGAFWQAVSEGTQLRAVTHGQRLRDIVGTVLDEPARPHDLMYLRPMVVGKSTPLHYDHPFFAGNSEKIHTVWIPFGDLEIENGPLMIVEGSQHFTDLVEPILSVDYSADQSNETVQNAAYENQNTSEPVSFVADRKARMLSANFQAGDIVIFTGCMLHGSLENCSPEGKVRLSCDVRYQPAADSTADTRYFGPNPTGSKGGGYTDMKGAVPLDE